MTALNPNIIKDTKKLVSLYQTNDRFRKAFDTVVAKNINATYKDRPIKLYVEVLAGISSEYKQDYNQVRRIPLHDKEGKVGELFKKIKPNDFFLLDATARAAEQGSNTTAIPTEAVEQINKIEAEAPTRLGKREAYIQRERESFAEEKTKTATEEKKEEEPEKTQPKVGQALTEKKGATSKAEEAKKPSAAPVSFPGIPEARNWSGRAGRVRQVFESPRQFVQSFFSRGVSSTATKAGVKIVSGGAVKTVSGRVGARFAGGRAAAAGAGKIAAKLGVGTAARVGAGLAAKAGLSIAAGAATGGISLAVQAAAALLTNPNVTKYIIYIVIGVVLSMFLLAGDRMGMKMNALLPPYSVGFAEPISTSSATPTPSGSITPTPSGTIAPTPSLPPGSNKLQNILYWAQLINNALQPGLPITSFNKMVANITNGSYTAVTRTAQDRGTGPSGIYWCTNIVIDAYNLAGISGLGPNQQGVRGMISFWQSTPNYSYIPYNGITSIQQVKPGFALFRLYPGDYNYDHASIIQEISIDERGNGFIKTLDSNSFKSWSSTIVNGQFVDRSFLADIVGFGVI